MGKEIKCKIKTCLNNDKGKCSIFIPTIVQKLSPNKVSCKLFDDDFQKSFEEFKNKGGVLGELARRSGKRTPSEIEKAKKAKRKTRSDKGQKKGPKKKKSKKENNLGDIVK